MSMHPSTESRTETTCQCPCGAAGHWVEAKPIERTPSKLPTWFIELTRPLAERLARWL